MKTTTYLENETSWLCRTCSTINEHIFEKCTGCESRKGSFVVAVRPNKRMTHKEWDQLKKFSKTDVDGVDFYSDLQMIMCQKYKITISDWMPKWIRRYATFKKYVNMTNFNKGIDKFNKGVQQFSGSLDSMSSEFGGSKKSLSSKKDKDNIFKLTGKRESSVGIWGKQRKTKSKHVPFWKETKEKKPPRKRRKRERKDTRSQGEKNVDMFWGKKK